MYSPPKWIGVASQEVLSLLAPSSYAAGYITHVYDVSPAKRTDVKHILERRARVLLEQGNDFEIKTQLGWIVL